MDKKRLNDELIKVTQSQIHYGIKVEDIPKKLMEAAIYFQGVESAPEELKNFIMNYLFHNASLHTIDKIKETKSFNSIFRDLLYDNAFKDVFDKDQVTPDFAKYLVKRYVADRGMSRDNAMELVPTSFGKTSEALHAYMYRKRKGG